MVVPKSARRPVLVDHGLARHGDVVVHRVLVLAVALRRVGRDIEAVGRPVDLLGQHLADVVLVRLEQHRLRQGGGQDLLRLSAVVAPHQVAGGVELAQLHVSVQLPQTLHPLVDLLLGERVVEVDLVVLVPHELLEPGLARVEQRLVVGDVLLLDHGDLGVEAAGDRLHVAVADGSCRSSSSAARPPRWSWMCSSDRGRPVLVVVAGASRRQGWRCSSTVGRARHDLGELRR
jgi:hypothetical protein